MDHQSDTDAQPSSVNSLISESSGVYSADTDGYRLPAYHQNFNDLEDRDVDKDDNTLVDMEHENDETKIESPNVDKRQFVEDWAAFHTTMHPDRPPQNEPINTNGNGKDPFTSTSVAFSLYSLPIFTLATSTGPLMPSMLSSHTSPPQEEESDDHSLPQQQQQSKAFTQFSYSCDSLDKIPSMVEVNDPMSLLSELTAADDLHVDDTTTDDDDDDGDQRFLKDSLDQPQSTLPRSSTPLHTQSNSQNVDSTNLPKIYRPREDQLIKCSQSDIETCLVKPVDSSTSYSDYVCVKSSIEEDPIPIMQSQETLLMEVSPAYQLLKVDVTSPEYAVNNNSPLVGKRCDAFKFDGSYNSHKSSPVESYLHEEDIGLPGFMVNVDDCLGRLSEITDLVNRPTPSTTTISDRDDGDDDGQFVNGHKIVSYFFSIFTHLSIYLCAVLFKSKISNNGALLI